MREENKIPFTYIAQQLDQARGKALGIYGLNILIYGALKKGIISGNSILWRKKRDGFKWLNTRELKRFSIYVGVPLRKAKEQKVGAKQ